MFNQQPPSIAEGVNVYGYCRVSTARQADEGVSLDTQQEALSDLARLYYKRDIPPENWFIDRGVSGGTALSKRPEGERLLSVVKSGDIILTTRLDRMFRNHHDALGVVIDFKRRYITLHFGDMGNVTGADHNGTLMFNILSSMGQFEKAKASDRVKDTKAYQRSINRFLGGRVPLGCDVVERIELNHKGEEVVKRYLTDEDLDFVLPELVAALRNTLTGKNNDRRTGYRTIAKIINEEFNYPISHMSCKRLIMKHNPELLDEKALSNLAAKEQFENVSAMSNNTKSRP
ncbi:recombinase family protein [Thaumasiovibrio sp. DFM-14]|uniref:recombinase family protein n=1 Tax=Thaumasiovibrio sp. DFM-14 TaxID=3384792 RepID=UPI0039A20663